MNRNTLSIMLTLFLLSTLLVSFTPSAQAVDWSGDTRLTFDDVEWDMAPSIIQTRDGKIWVVWHSTRTGNNDLFYKTYNGSSWSSETQLTTDNSHDLNPSIMQADDDRVWVVWDTDRRGFDEDVYYKVFNGTAWSNDTPLIIELQPDKNPSITQALDGRIWVVWSTIRTGNPEIFYKVFNGSAWSNDYPLTTDQNHDDEDPAVMQASDGKIWVVWSKTPQATGKTSDIYFKTFDGAVWSAEAQLTTDLADDVNPAITQTLNQRIWVAWSSNRNANNENVYYKIFDGISWTGDTQLTIAMEQDLSPSITQVTDGSIWIAWASKRVLAQFDLYYKTGMEFHDVAVLGVTPYASHETFAYRGERVYIEVGVQNNGEARETVEVKCYVNSSLIKSRTISLASGQYYSMAFDWSTTKATVPGVYVFSAEAVRVLGESNVTNNLNSSPFEVRILGDIAGLYGGVVQPIPDRRVNIVDFGIPIGHYGCMGPSWPHPTWDPVADVNEDLLVDLDDIMTVGAHYGER